MTIAPNVMRLFDFGQNLAGWVTFRVEAGAGQRLRIRCGELPDRDGSLTLRNIQCVRGQYATLLQTIDYTYAEGENRYRMPFSVFGFRCAEVDSDVVIGPEDIEAIAVYSDRGQTGFFSAPMSC